MDHDKSCFNHKNLNTLWLFNIATENGPFIDDFPKYKPPFMVGIFHCYVKDLPIKNREFP